MDSDLNIKLKKKELSLDDGYLSLSSSKIFGSINNSDDIMKFSTIPQGFEQHRMLQDSVKKKKNKEPVVELSDEIKTDLKVLKMRSAFDKKRFYKKIDIKPSSEIKVGRVLDNPADFYSSRLPKKLRKNTLIDELLSDAAFKKQVKKSYTKILTDKKLTNPTASNNWRRKLRKRRRNNVE